MVYIVYMCVITVVVMSTFPHVHSGITQLSGHDLHKRSSESCSCGKNSDTRIIGGKDADVNEWPWIAALCFTSPCDRDSHFCGGSVVNDLYILTAAHCIYNMDEKDILVSLGDYSLVAIEAQSEEFGVEKVILHEKYQSGIEKNDIALLRLDRRITFSEAIIPICLPPPARLYSHKNAYVIGWGTLSYEKSNFTKILQEVSVPVLSNLECKRKYGRKVITDKMICAGKSGLDSCQGDSGGPLMFLDESNSFTQIGVVSFGYKCGDSHPGVYTRVNKYLVWINYHIRDGTRC